MERGIIKTVFVIEDNPGDFAIVENFLLDKIEDASISHAKNFNEAKEILTQANKHFDVVLLDLSLPDKTGIELIQEIVEISADIPVIVLTGYADFQFGVQSLALGISDYILKDELTPLMLYKSMVYSVERKKITTDLEKSEKRVRSFANQLNNALEEERSRIAREIHDEFGQQLSGFKMSLSAIKKFVNIDKSLVTFIDLLLADVNNSIESVRQIANDLRPVIIDKLGLFAAIQWLVTEFENKNKIKTWLYSDYSNNSVEPNKTLEINIFRICQEALTNISKHSGANEVKIYFESKDDLLHVKIFDNGCGIKASSLHNPLSMGMLNMQERANLIGASLNIHSSSETGTVIELNVNLNGKTNFNC